MNSIPLTTPNAAALAEISLAWADGKLGDTPIVIAASAPHLIKSPLRDPVGAWRRR